MTVQIEQFSYDDAIVRKFTLMTFVWGVVGMLVGVIVALELAAPVFNFELPWLSFGRLRPLHTNAVIFAFAGNAIFAGVYYSMQRLLKTAMFSKALGAIHFWGWQAIIVAAAVTLPLGITQGKEYAELQWPIDIAIAVIWVVFAINAFGTIAIRRERHIYVAIWFYIATIVTIALLHIFNNLAVPAGLWRSYPIYAGVQDAFMQWWYGHNAVGFLLTTPFLGLMYYFLPKAANRPVFSYRLSIIHFWSLVFLYIWAGPHHLHYTALPAWASTLGMVFSLMLWMPSWGGMLNGLLTLRGAWDQRPPDLARSVGQGRYGPGAQVLRGRHYLLRHVHLRRTAAVDQISKPALALHRLDHRPRPRGRPRLGRLSHLRHDLLAAATPLPDRAVEPQAGRSPLLARYHRHPAVCRRHLRGRPHPGSDVARFRRRGLPQVRRLRRNHPAPDPDVLGAGDRRPRLPDRRTTKDYTDRPEPPTSLEKSGAHVVNLAYKLDRFFSTTWHRRWERLPLRFTVAVVITVVVASLFEIIPTFLIKSNVPTIATVTPYTPLELVGRDIYISEGCYNCHSQMIRPIRAETERYGEYSKPGEFRIGPDLQRVGGKYPDLWHVRHMDDPRAITAGSIMPAFPWLLTVDLDFNEVPRSMRANRAVGVPYSNEEIADGEAAAHEQAQAIADEIVIQGGPEGLADKQIVAIIAYLQRLGTDITKPEPVAVEKEIGLIEAAAEVEGTTETGGAS